MFALSVLLGLAAVGLYFYQRAAAIPVAVGPRDSPQANFVREIGDALAARRQGFRLAIEYSSGAEESAKSLLAGGSKLAVLRSDFLEVKNARALVILQRRTMFAVARLPEPKGAAKVGGWTCRWQKGGGETKQKQKRSRRFVQGRGAEAAGSARSGARRNRAPTRQPGRWCDCRRTRLPWPIS